MRAAGAMGEALAQRAPQEASAWSDAAAGIALVQRSGAAADRYPPATALLQSSCRRFVLACEGEVYNAAALVAELRQAGRVLAGRSDLEVIVEGAALWGIEATARRLNGAFAAAIWDRQSRALHLLRDRLGMRPLYWAATPDAFLFAAELKAIRACGLFHAELDRDIVASFLRRRCVPGPHTIYRGAHMLEPGIILSLAAEGEPSIRRYWSLADSARAGQANRFAGSNAEAARQLEDLLLDAVRSRQGSESIGVFLSGGIDSSTMLAMLKATGGPAPRSYSVGFYEDAYNEADHAGAVANHLGVEHSPLFVSAENARDLIPRLPEIYDEPMADVSQIPTYFLSRLARRDVRVAVTGDGGDELFGGYERYLQATDFRRWTGWMPRALRTSAGSVIRVLSADRWTQVSCLLPRRIRPAHLGERLHTAARLLAQDDDGIYRLIVSYWRDPHALVPDAREPLGVTDDPAIRDLVPDFVERMQYFDSLTILPDGALTKVDRAASAAGLTIRMPFLDPALVDFSWTLPPALKLRGRVNKWLLRQVLYRHVPPAILERPKMGFDVPIGAWLRGPLRDWAEDLLDEQRLRREGIFEPAPIRAIWREHLSERRNRQGPLWVVLMFQAWKQRWLP
jgi:asparagine synthase (glutamine-hydrolysing)